MYAMQIRDCKSGLDNPVEGGLPMKKHLWGGRFRGKMNERFQRINASLTFDHRLLRADVQVSVAHLASLQEAGVVTEDEAEALRRGLGSIEKRVRDNPRIIQDAVVEGIEDVHSFVEGELAKELGQVAYRLHTGRSRNDQVATDLRLFVGEAIGRILALIRETQEALVDLAEAYPGSVLPGYTHLQRAQPVLFAHYILAFFEMLQRDYQRFEEALNRTLVSPLGSAAMAGSSYRLSRQLQCRRLGFRTISKNSMDAVSDRDFLLEFTGAASILMIHLSRLAEDFTIYCSQEFAFFELNDSVSTGSSLLPHKKNPDGLELVRGKSARVIGHHTALLVLLKGLPLTYNKDLQEDKIPTFETIELLEDSLDLVTLTLKNLQFFPDRSRQACQDDYSNAIALADYLVAKGMPFRQAHEVTGQVVLYAMEKGKRLQEVSLGEYRDFSELLAEDFVQAISLEEALAKKSLPGGTAPDTVSAAIRAARRTLQA